MTIPDPIPRRPDAGEGALLFAANRAAVAFTIARWLLHDLRNPVQMLSLLPDLVDADTGVLDPTASSALGGAVERLHEASVLLDELLRQPPPPGDLEPIDLTTALDYVSRLGVRPRMGVQLQVDPVPPGLPAARGLDYWITQIVLNLILNSVESTADREAGIVTVRVDHVGSHLRIAVRDDGPGIPAAVRETLFDVGVTTKRYRPVVAGLGLPVARMLAEAMGGTVRVGSTGEAGTVMEALIGTWA
jgi:signal transduction histidine kinase